jgi:hypothetical protein
MSFPPKHATVGLDYETSDSRGASFEYFRKDFQVFSLSLAWRDQTKRKGTIQHFFSTDPIEICKALQILHNQQNPLVVHNMSFERGVTETCYPGLSLNWYCDTMRLAQHYDGGSEYWVKYEPTVEEQIALELGEMTEADLKKRGAAQVGLSLEACGMRFLSDTTLHSHKAEAHGYLKEHHGIRSKHGQFLHLLPYDVLERYNNADTKITLLLYEELTARLRRAKFGWSKDNTLYLDRAALMTKAYARGICINRPKLLKYIIELEQEIKDMENAFLDRFEEELKMVRELRLQKHKDTFINDPTAKQVSTSYNRFINTISGKYDKAWRKFNVGSTMQLTLLFVDVLNMKPVFFTPKGAPSFKTTHLHQWGEGGKILQKRKKRLLVLQQCINTYIGSAYDGKIHPSVKVSGTKTNRVAGGRDA